MSQLTSSDNCEPRALSKGTTVIVLIGSPLLCWERKMLSNVIVPQHLKIRHAHIGHQKGRCRFLFTEDNDLVLWHSPWPPLHTGTSRHISNSRERPRWPAEALDDWARGAWHSSWPITTDVLIKAVLASRLEDFARVGDGCAAALAAFPFLPPQGLGTRLTTGTRV